MAVNSLIVDANIIVSALLKDSFTRKLLVSLRKPKLSAPEFILEELSKYLPEFAKRMGISESSLRTVMEQLFKASAIKIVFKEEYAEYLQKARTISLDAKDAPYLALALKTHSPIWSQDKHFKEQKQVKIYTTKELFEKLASKSGLSEKDVKLFSARIKSSATKRFLGEKLIN